MHCSTILALVPIAFAGCVGSSGGGDDVVESDGPSVSIAAIDDTYFTHQNTRLVVAPDVGLFSNDLSGVGDRPMLAVADAVSEAGGVVNAAADGAFDYVPPPDFWGPDRFGYTRTDRTGAQASATVTVHVAPARIDLASVALGVGGFVVEGQGASAGVGAHVRGAGDVNGDGLGDIVIGNPFAHGSGRAWVVFGKVDGGSVEQEALGDAGLVLVGGQPGDAVGVSVAGAGDVNGDGFADVVVGAPLAATAGTASGVAYVVFGGEDLAPVMLAELGNRGFEIRGAGPDERAGQSVAGAGDMNGDGLSDVIVGAPFASPGGSRSGRVSVVFGKPGVAAVELGDLGARGFHLHGEVTNDWSGTGVGGGMDFNGDGLSDAAVGAPLHDAAVGGAPAGSLADAGRAYVVFGERDPSDRQLGALEDGGLILQGIAADAQAGAAVAAAGDYDGDGADELLVGAPLFDGGGAAAGRVYLVFGAPDLTGPEIAPLDTHLSFDGQAPGDQAGAQVGAAGDVNGDGFDDVIVGAPYAGAAADRSGRVYVIYGGEARPNPGLGSLGQDGVAGFVADGAHEDALVGSAVAGGVDVNGDGVSDVLVVGRESDGAGFRDRVFVVFGVRMRPG